MINFILENQHCFQNSCLEHVCSMAFDGAYLYFCDCDCPKVYQVSTDGEMVDCHKTNQAYGSICYDDTEDCFWAIPYRYPGYIYKLNRCMEEESRLHVPLCGYDAMMTIAYNGCNDTLLLFAPGMTMELNKCGEIVHRSKSCRKCFSRSGATGPGITIVNCNYNTCGIGVLYAENKDGCVVTQQCLPEKTYGKSVCIAYSATSGVYAFVLAVRDSSSPCLLQYHLTY